MDIRKIICGFIGHSHICDMWFGRISCARCGEVLVDEMTQIANPGWRKTLIFRENGHYNKKAEISWKDRIFLIKA